MTPLTPTPPTDPPTSAAPSIPSRGSSPDLLRIVRDYARAARAYDAMAVRLREAAPASEALEVGEQGAAILAIVHGCAADCLSRGAQAARDAAGRLCAWGGLPVEFAENGSVGAEVVSPDVATASAPSGGFFARWYEGMAKELYGWVELLADDAEAAVGQTGDRALVGDTHPYGDVIYGIVIPYLFRAADVLRGVE